MINQVSQSFTAQRLIAGLSLGFIGAAVNYYGLFPLYGNLTIHFGEVLAIICLARFGLAAGLLASLLSSTGLYLAINNSSYFLLFSLEIVVLYILARRGVSLLIADLCYWFAIGLPLTFAVVYWIFSIEGDFLSIVLFKQGINGILTTAIACLILPFIPHSFLSIYYKQLKPKLVQQIFSLSVLSISIPSLIIALILTANSADRSEKLIEDQLANKAKHLASSVDTYLDLHLHAVKSLALTLSQIPQDNSQQSLLLADQKALVPGFVSMIISDENGKVIHGAPSHFYQKMLQLSPEKQTVKDRDYFRVAKLERHEFVSQVFRGRGFGNSPIVAVSAPIINKEEFFGIVEGSLNLPNFSEIEESTHQDDEFLLVSDRNNQIIYASSPLELKELTPLVTRSPLMFMGNKISALEINGKVYLYSKWVTNEGWLILTLKNPDIIYRFLSDSVLVVSFSLLLVILFFLLVTRHFAAQITRPLELLITHFGNKGDNNQISIPRLTSRELVSLFERLSAARQLTLEFQTRLSSEVKLKTNQLTKLNNQLEVLAKTDGLTQLLNRRAFDEEAQKLLKASARHKAPLSFAIIDIDEFKVINDTLGHPAGDHCIKFVASRLAETFQRDTDIVGRYGGEEFALLLSGAEIDFHNKMLIEFHQGIANTQVVYKQRVISLTVSIGVFMMKHNSPLSYTQLVSNADKLLYKAKHNGRNRVEFGSS